MSKIAKLTEELRTATTQVTAGRSLQSSEDDWRKKRPGEPWWAHELGRGSGLVIGPFRSAEAAKKYLKDERQDSGPFKNQADSTRGFHYVGQNFAIDQIPPKPGKKVTKPRIS